MSDLTERLEQLAGYHCPADAGLIREAAAEIRRLVLASGQPEIDRCDEVIRLRTELAVAYTALVRVGLAARDAAPPQPAPVSASVARAFATAFGAQSEWVDGLGVIDDESE